VDRSADGNTTARRTWVEPDLQAAAVMRRRRTTSEAGLPGDVLLPLNADLDQNNNPEVAQRGRISMHGKRLEPHELDKIASATVSY
jgi:hypothetical protein